jgi:hypothetical protein
MPSGSGSFLFLHCTDLHTDAALRGACAQVSSPTNRRQMFVPLVKKFPEKEIHFIHPGFVGRAMDLWFELKMEVEARNNKKYHDKPMSGFMAVMFMSQVALPTT